jgi:AcrR family transcriptional regulator
MTTRRPPDGEARPRRGQDTVARLLDAALAVYASSGFEGFTVHAVVAASGASLGSLYHHFGSFEGLAAALYARCLARLLDGIGDAVTPARTARAGLASLVRAYLAHAAQHPAEARFIHASSYAGYLPAHAQLIAREKAPRLERIFAWLRPHVRAGVVVNLPEPLIEMVVVGPVAETARRFLAGAPDIDLDEAARLLPERIWRALRRRERVVSSRARRPRSRARARASARAGTRS